MKRHAYTLPSSDSTLWNFTGVCCSCLEIISRRNKKMTLKGVEMKTNQRKKKHCGSNVLMVNSNKI